MKIFKLFLAGALLITSAFAQEDITAKRELAREVMSASQVNRMFDSMGPQLKQLILQQAPIPADATPEKKQKFEELLSKVMDLSMQETKTMLAKMDLIYAKVYTEPELRAMLAFFNSAEGQSMLAKQPQIMAQVMPLAQEMQRSMMPKIKKLVDEAKADLEQPSPKE